MKRLVLLLFFTAASLVAFAQTALEGKVIDTSDDDAPLIFATVQLYKEGVFVQGVNTDFDGNYYFSNIDPGSYSLRVGYTGYPEQRLTGIDVLANKINRVDVEMTSEGGVIMDEIVVIEKRFEKPLIQQDNTTSGGIVTSAEIENLPTRNINQIASTVAGVSSADEGGALNIKGSRSNATDYYVDGVRVSAVSIPDTEIEQVEVITGGISARYGDVTGGIISITTKGFSDEFFFSATAETSEGLDDYGNSLVDAAISGPLVKKNDKSIVGYRLSARYTYNEDDNPSAVPIFVARDEVIAELEERPVTGEAIDGNDRPFVTAETILTEDDAIGLDTRPNEASSRLNLNGNVTTFLSDNIDVQLSGAYSNGENQFTPGGWQLLNTGRNPTQNSENYRGNIRLRHRLGSNRAATGQNATTTSLIQNASYDLQFTYENRNSDLADPIHGDNFGAYGHIGNYDVDYIPIYTFNGEIPLDSIPLNDSRRFDQVDYRTVLRGADFSGSSNPILANYNQDLNADDIGGFSTSTSALQGTGQQAIILDNFRTINGRTLGTLTGIHGFHSNVGPVYNLYQTTDNDRYTFQANAQFQIIPGGKSEKSRHNVQVGVWYEQRTDRSYRLNPANMWTVARQRANEPLGSVDLTNRVVDSTDLEFAGQTVRVPVLAPTVGEGTEGFFTNIRERLGLGLDEFVNVDGLDPEQLTLDLFGAEEVTRAGLLDYVGYDYLGNEFNGSFDDFFALDPTTGDESFNVAPNRPIYAAAYLQDKFTINKMIFRVGVRVDRYDANTRVLQDPYSLYATQSAADFHANSSQIRPGNIGDDFAVYLDDYEDRRVVAYRDGDLWFEADGTPVNQFTEIDAIRGGLVNPALENSRAETEADYIKSGEFSVESSFEDYEVQFNVMPRLAFSFPISDKANFFAHYDVLVQRPPSNTVTTALDYFFFLERASSGIFNNPNLRPERTIDYEVGFKTLVGNRSALTIGAYYKELRDMIQQRTFAPVYQVGQYTTYDNLDFGTVKGFNLTYDLRRTKNFMVNANYTLQFADGTGSSSTSSRGLTNRGNIRTLFPLSYDERHRVNLTLDYRLGADAPLKALQDVGVNVFATAVTGRPYTGTTIPGPLSGTGREADLNGSRQPFNFTVNAQVNKNIVFNNGSRLRLYVRVSNLLDRRNVINVYSFTGSPSDPGFLQSEFGQDAIGQLTGQRTPESYLASYQWSVLNPNFFSLPRRIFAGAIFSL